MSGTYKRQIKAGFNRLSGFPDSKESFGDMRGRLGNGDSRILHGFHLGGFGFRSGQSNHGGSLTNQARNQA